MIPLFVLGINHDSASVEVRESTRVIEAAIMSTCNRTELYVALEDDAILEPDTALVDASKGNISTIDASIVDSAKVKVDNAQTLSTELLQWLADHHHLEVETLRPCHYLYTGEDAIRHMMCVASGLDSSCYAVAQSADALGSELHQAFQKIFSVAKRVRTDTAIGENPVSVAYAAVSLAQQIFSDLTEDTALLIGAGETIDLVARHLRQKGIANMMRKSWLMSFLQRLLCWRIFLSS